MTVMASDPVLIAYAVWRGKGGHARYQRIGQAYSHARGEGLNVIFDVWPVWKDWRLVLLELDEADDRRLLAEAKRLGSRESVARKKRV
jgi:hypothetical protein